MDTYKIVRFYQNRANKVIQTGLSLDEARAWCEDPETSSRTATSKAARKRTRKHGPWFEGYRAE